MMNAVPTMIPDDVWFQRMVGEWWTTHCRSFPWRTERDPYAVLIAEMMLHRTRASQVEPVYSTFLKRFPDPATLAQAGEGEVRSFLAPLGLAWRQGNFIPLARTILTRHSGQIPRDRQALLGLPGVGPYVADAVRVFAFGEHAALIDANTVRVAGRFFGFATHAESRRKRSVQDAVARLIYPSNPRRGNLAVLDFAAQVCRPRDPRCACCPVAERCIAAGCRQSVRSDTAPQSEERRPPAS